MSSRAKLRNLTLTKKRKKKKTHTLLSEIKTKAMSKVIHVVPTLIKGEFDHLSVMLYVT